MKRSILMIAMLIIMGSLASGVCYDLSDYDDIIYVDGDNGDDSSGDGTENNPYKSVEKAVSVTGNNDAVFLKGHDSDSGDVSIEGGTLNLIGDYLEYGSKFTGQIHGSSSNYGTLNVYNVYLEQLSSGSWDELLFYLNADLHNCVFKDYSGYSNVYGTYDFYNTFIIDIGSIYSSTDLIDCATAESYSYDDEFNLGGTDWIDAGSGTDLDGSPADLGVYGGACDWDYTEDSVCGDGNLSLDEECDDGNTADGDGCNASCNVEDGYYCEGEPSLCFIPELDDYLLSYYGFDQDTETIAYDPINDNHGRCKFQFDLREHKYSSTRNPKTEFSKESGALKVVSLGDSVAGAGHIFQTFEREYLQGKTIKIDWSTKGGSYNNMGEFKARIYDGAYNKTSSTDFPDQQDIAEKGGGLLQVIEDITASSSRHISSAKINLRNSTEDQVTLMVSMYDEGDWTSAWTEMYIYSIEILEDDVIAKEADLTGDISMDYVSYADRGTIGTMQCPEFKATGGFDSDGAVDFDGIDDNVLLESDTLGTEADSLCMWIYPTGWGENGYGRIVDNGRFIVNLNQDNNYLQFSSDGASNSSYSAANSISLNTWQYVCIARDAAGTSNIYINGALSGSSDQDSGSPLDGTSVVYFGDRSAGERAFQGKIDEIAVYEREISVSDVSDLYNGGEGYKSISYSITEPDSWNGFDLYHINGTLVGKNTSETVLNINKGSDKKVEFKIIDDINKIGS